MKKVRRYINDEQDVKFLCKLATKLCDLPEGILQKKVIGSKAEKYSVPRAAVAVIARKSLGIHYTVIAEILKKDRTSIYHYEKKHDIDYISYPKYKKTFNNIHNTYLDIQSNKKKFDSPGHLRETLKNLGISNDSNGNMKINVMTDDYTVTLKSSFKDLSNNYELCNNVLSNYKCKIQIET